MTRQLTVNDAEVMQWLTEVAKASGPRHPGQFGGELGGSVGFDLGDAFDAGVKFVTHPADDVSAAGQIITHPEDDWKFAISKGPDMVVDGLNAYFIKYPGAVFDFVSKNAKDFAKSSLGKTVLDIATGAIYMMGAPILGPVMLLSFAVPGLMRGNDFTTAWLQGALGQAQRGAQALGVSGFDFVPPDVQDQVTQFLTTYNSQIGTASELLQKGAPALQALGLPTDPSQIDPVALAGKLGIRVDSAWAAIANASNNPSVLNAFNRATFDPITGNITGGTITQKFASTEMNQQLLMRLAQYQKDGIAFEGKAPAAAAGRKLSKDPGWIRGYDVGMGMMQDHISAADLATIRSQLSPASAVTGFDAGVSTYRGVITSAGHPAAKGNLFSQKAGALAVIGLIGAPMSVSQGVLGTVAQNPVAQSGANQAMATISHPDKTIWEKILGFFGL